jgi:hypothetical protein
VSDGGLNVAYVAVYTTSTPDTQIAIVGSHDGGATFGAATNQVRSVTADGGGAGQGCNNGPSRSPTVAVDMTTASAVFPNPPTPTPTFWVAWGHNGAGTFGGCVRTYQFDSSGNLSAAGAAAGGFTIDNMAPEALGDSQGALIIQANDGMATVVYSNQDHVPSTTADCGSDTSIGWGAVSTTNGDDWTDHSEVFHTSNFAWCTVTDGSAFPGNPKVIKGRREFDFIIAPDGNSYVAINDAKDSIRLFMSTTRGVKVNGMGAPNDSPWREFCPNNASNWTDPGIHPCGTGWFPGEGGTTEEVFRPTLSADGNSGVALMWYQTVQLPSPGPAIFGIETQWDFASQPRMFGSTYTSEQTIENGFDPNPSGTTFDRHTAVGLYNTMPASRPATASCAGSTNDDIQPYWSVVANSTTQVIDTISTP